MASMDMKKERPDDLEAQLLKPRQQYQTPASPGIDSEYRVSSLTKLSYLGLYFLCNISLTIYNKLILGKVSKCRGTLVMTY